MKYFVYKNRRKITLKFENRKFWYIENRRKSTSITENRKITSESQKTGEVVHENRRNGTSEGTDI